MLDYGTGGLTMGLEQFFPPLETTLELGTEELAIPLLKSLIQQQQVSAIGLHLGNYVGSQAIDDFAGDKCEVIMKAITEAWVWLERELMLAPIPGKGRDWLYVTKKGEKLAGETDISKYMAGNIIPLNSLDPVLAGRVLPLFVRGDYDIAVFQAFKEVEIRVRLAASLSDKLVGVPLMRTAFHIDSGKLADKKRHEGERQATSDLFAGAIGLFKNPSSHRDVNWEDPIECVELIYLANHLLRLVERHKQAEDSK